MTWTGWDGSVWDLVNGEVSGISLLAGVRGLTRPPSSRYTSSSPAIAGSRWLGSRDEERPVFWPVKVYTDAGSQAWIEHDAAFWRTLAPGRTGVWEVKQPNGVKRFLRVRFTGDGDGAFDLDPTLVGWAVYEVYGVAEDPYWYGDPISRVFEPSDPIDFLPTTGGPPFRISEGSLTATAQIANPGDEEAWVQWWITDATSAVVGVGDRLITVPFEVADGRLLVVDATPTAREAIEIDTPPLATDGGPLPLSEQVAWVEAHLPTGINRTLELGAATKWAPVQPSAAADLSISVVGTTAKVRATIVPRHHRAW